MDFHLRPTLIDLEAIHGEIRVTIKERQHRGVYEHFDLTRVTAWELLDIKDPAERLSALLKTIQASSAIDITDYDMARKPSWRGRLEKGIKTGIWKCIRFYTFRLFYQQREFNAELQTAIRLHHEYVQKEVQALKKRIASLRREQGGK